MAITRQTPQKCGTCLLIDRESYRGVKMVVCYLVEKKDNKPIAIAVTDNRVACQHYRDAR